MTHRPHDTRHTSISTLIMANVKPNYPQNEIGYTNAMRLTERVYAHFEIQPLLEAIDSI
ncbi:hypothetical protein SANA_22700 [Gottschalkiaceae bacterium SANA]|nr:hypothetical protein SANA_22700 [Gottschalkiaceae bacterium SANA]